jgi:zinc protease
MNSANTMPTRAGIGEERRKHFHASPVQRREDRRVHPTHRKPLQRKARQGHESRRIAGFAKAQGEFATMAAQTKVMLANQQASPEYVFQQTLIAALTQDHPRARLMTPAMVDQMNLERSFAFYKDRFADASDFTFVFAGSFDIDTIRPYVVRYLGALPSLRRRETWKDTGINPPRGVITKTVEKGIEPQSRARIVFAGPFQFTPQSRVTLRAMGMMLEGRLGQVLRVDQSGTYGVQVTPRSQRVPDAEYQVAIDFTCAPERTEELVRMVLDEIARFRANGPATAEVEDIRRALLREYETNSRENRYMVSEIVSRIEAGEDVRGIQQTPDLYKRLSSGLIQDAARAYLDPANYVRVTLIPEKKK